MMNFLKSFFSVIKPLESKLFESLKANLEPRAKEILDSQIKKINLVQRHAGGKEVCLYFMSNGKPFFDESIRFPYAVTKAKLATIEFSFNDKSDEFTVDFWLVNGFIFSLIFNKSPQRMLNRIDMTVSRVNILVNPLAKISGGEISNFDTTQRCPKEWTSKFAISGSRNPLSSEEKDNVLRSLKTSFPSEYLDLVRYSDGCETKDFIVYGLREISEIVFPDANYLGIVEFKGKGMLGIKRYTQSGDIYYFNYQQDEKVESVGKSLFSVIEKISKQS
jgi:hypothetical protein